jgi:hypothetical protein
MMKLTREHFNVSRHVKPTLWARIAKKIRLWRRLRNVSIAKIAHRRLSDAVSLDRAEIYDPLYAAKRDALERGKR